MKEYNVDPLALAALEKKSNHLAERRHATAQELLCLGVECLHEALAAQLQDRELLAEACENFMDAIRHNRTDPDPYIGLGYLLWLAQEYEDALLYLSEAIILDPQNADARKLVRLTQQAMQRPAQQLSMAPIQAEDEYERMYDALEAKITEEVKRLSSRKPDWFAISDDRFKVQRMEREFQALIRTHSQLSADLAIVAQEFDCEDLQQKMHPLNTFLRKAKEVLLHSWQQIELQEVLDGHNGWLERELRRSQGQLAANFSRERFDYLLDDCDQLADRLDELEQSGGDVSALVAAYELMIAKVAQIQALLDALYPAEGVD